MKSLFGSLAIVASAISLSPAHAEPQTFMSFDFANGLIENGFGKWFYSDKGENPCGVYAGELQSKLCTADGYKFYPYYNGRNSDHMGWLQYGYIDADSQFSVSGSALKMHLTGGFYKGLNDEPTEDGELVKSKSDFIGDSMLGSQEVLPGDLALYYKGPTDTSKISEFNGKNRLTLWVLMPKGTVDIDKYSAEYQLSPSRNFSFYPFIDTSKGAHYYHFASNIPMGGWTKIQFDASPTHKNTGAPNDLHAFQSGGVEYPGQGTEYFSNMAAFALRADFSKFLPANSVYYIDEIETDFVAYENEETIKSLSVGFNPSNKLFDISLEDKYRCSSCEASYEVRYSFEPIDNSNFDLASLPKHVTNFNRSMSNSEGLLHKPENGYNLVWGAITLQDQDLSKVQDGSTIYFAVKDVSQRAITNHYPEDNALIDVPGVGLVAKNRLIKSIAYQIFDVHYPLSIETESKEKPIVGYEYEQSIAVDGGVAPYLISADNLPAGISLDGSTLKGVPLVKGESNASVVVYDSVGAVIEKELNLGVLSESDLIVEQCQVVVDFDNSVNVVQFDAYDTLIHDSYTGLFASGMTTVVGSNGEYNYQGIQGAGLTLMPGDQIRVIWRNVGDKTATFYPKVSFNESGRVNAGSDENWFDFIETKVAPNEVKVGVFVVKNTVEASVININSNFSNHKTLLLEQIEVVSEQFSQAQHCQQPINFKKVQDTLIVDFDTSINESAKMESAFDTIFMDRYTDFHEDGVAIVIGSNKLYNYQGVKGVGTEIDSNTVIKVTWKNYSDQTFNFSPNISFNFEGRIINGGTWYAMSDTTIDGFDLSNQKPGEAVSYFNFTNLDWMTYISLININSEVSDNKGLVLDKIEIVK